MNLILDQKQENVYLIKDSPNVFGMNCIRFEIHVITVTCIERILCALACVHVNVYACSIYNNDLYMSCITAHYTYIVIQSYVHVHVYTSCV